MKQKTTAEAPQFLSERAGAASGMNERDSQLTMLEQKVVSLLENLKEKSLHDFGVGKLFLNTLNIKTSRTG